MICTLDCVPKQKKDQISSAVWFLFGISKMAGFPFFNLSLMVCWKMSNPSFTYLSIPAKAEHDLENDILKYKVLIVVWNS